ncbi:hypothetical protein B0H21DRAFT_776436 [Amylocystis lapponica]|nr:hypothetical protein B0H21DRAFT_776436 [Amylocystis lapponica]
MTPRENASKKWNKHNSILFTLAGLPRRLAQLTYNIHFLSTSNLAPPLEMIEELVRTLKEAHKDGIAAWDCHHQEDVLLVPWVLAFLGDNPMASEFASHVGMQGKSFCRACKVKTYDQHTKKGDEDAEIHRVAEFLKPGEPRSKSHTRAELTSQLDSAVKGAPSTVDDMAAQSGVKDKYFAHFVAQLQEAASELQQELQKKQPAKRGVSKSDEVKELLTMLRARMPENIFSPVLDIPDFDPNVDTPFEALHYAVSRQSTEGKETLKTRLSSLDTSGLGISPLRGHTLVQYAGSLVGRDFRAILQVGPAVLHGLIPEEAYEAWVALAHLGPLVFQPAINNLDSYLVSCQYATSFGLAETSPCRFNLRMLLQISWLQQPCGHLSGSTSRNSIYSFILQHTSEDLVQPVCTQRKVSNLTT